MRSGSGPGTFFAATYRLKAATLKPSFFAACRMENELIGNIVPDNLSDVKCSFGGLIVSDFAALMASVRAGAKVIIENGARPVAVLHAAEPMWRTITECIALAKAHEEETGKAPVLDPDFAEDVEEILSHRKPWNPPAWE